MRTLPPLPTTEELKHIEDLPPGERSPAQVAWANWARACAGWGKDPLEYARQVDRRRDGEP